MISTLIFMVFGTMVFSLVHAQATATAADTTSAQNSTRTTVGAIAPPTPYFSESDTEYWSTRLSSEARVLSHYYGPYTTSTMFWPDWKQKWGSWISAASSDGPNNETTIWDVYTEPRLLFCTPEVRGSQYPSAVWALVKSQCTPSYAVTSGPTTWKWTKSYLKILTYKESGEYLAATYTITHTMDCSYNSIAPTISPAFELPAWYVSNDFFSYVESTGMPEGAWPTVTAICTSNADKLAYAHDSMPSDTGLPIEYITATYTLNVGGKEWTDLMQVGKQTVMLNPTTTLSSSTKEGGAVEVTAWVRVVVVVAAAIVAGI